MSKEHLLNLLCRVYVQEISADEAYDELGDLIDRIKRLEEVGGACNSRYGRCGLYDRCHPIKMP